MQIKQKTREQLDLQLEKAKKINSKNLDFEYNDLTLPPDELQKKYWEQYKEYLRILRENRVNIRWLLLAKTISESLKLEKQIFLTWIISSIIPNIILKKIFKIPKFLKFGIQYDLAILWNSAWKDAWNLFRYWIPVVMPFVEKNPNMWPKI